MLFCLLAELSGTTPNEPNHQTLTPFSLILPNIWESFCTFDVDLYIIILSGLFSGIGFFFYKYVF